MTDYTEQRDKVLAAFKDLRQQGFLARANFSCCSGCAGYAMGDRVTNMTQEQVAKVKGCAFWTRQDEENLKEDGQFYVAYGCVGSTKYGDVGLPTAEVGRAVVEALWKQGVKVTWDGDEATRLFVDLNV
jgi:hypothetical protein